MWSVVPQVRTVVVAFSFNAMFTVECNSLTLQMIMKQTLYKMCGFNIIRPHRYAQHMIWPIVTVVSRSVCLSVGHNLDAYKNV